jgi:hypothetical protein
MRMVWKTVRRLRAHIGHAEHPIAQQLFLDVGNDVQEVPYWKPADLKCPYLCRVSARSSPAGWDLRDFRFSDIRTGIERVTCCADYFGFICPYSKMNIKQFPCHFHLPFRFNADVSMGFGLYPIHGVYCIRRRKAVGSGGRR